MPKKSKEPGGPPQSERFIEAARELGCDEDEDAFKDRLKKLASAPPPETVRERKKPKKTDE
jgi:hypothetical protein